MDPTNKIQLHQKCYDICKQRVQDLKNIIQEAQDAANNETKSSAGDKHETGRAMAQLETEKLTKQLTEALKLTQTLDRIDPSHVSEKISLGSLVTTNNGTFYLAVSLGKMELESHSYFVISTPSPIGKQLIGLKENDTFSFNGRKYIIEKVI